MNTPLSKLLLAALCAAPVFAQVESKADSKPPVATHQDSKKPEASKDVAELLSQLGDADYQVRKKAEDALRQRGKDVLGALENAAEGHEDEEIRWRARRLAKQIQGGDSGALRKRGDSEPEGTPGQRRQRIFQGTPPRSGSGQDLDEHFNQIFERMEREFGIDVPRQRFFQDDFFKDLDRQMQDLRAHGRSGQGSSMQMNMGPDGVKVRIEQRGEDGKAETKTYEAPSLEEFRAKYPDVAKQYLDGEQRGMRFDMPGFRVFRRAPGGQGQIVPGVPFRDLEVQPEAVAPSVDEIPAGERLGVYVEPIGDEVREHLGLDATQGLRIKEAMSGGLGEQLGLGTGDILTEIGGTKICAIDDVRSALRGIAAGKPVEVKVYRKGKELTLSATKAEAGKELKKKGQIR